MQQSDEFPEIGKKIPYREPDDFFEGLSEKILQQAKIREQNRRKSLVLWRTLVVAASISVLAFIGYFMLEPEKPVINQIVLEQQPVIQPQIKAQKIENKPEVAVKKKVVVQKAPEGELKEVNTDEEISDIMADLSNEELLQLAAMYEADPFINVSEQ